MCEKKLRQLSYFTLRWNVVIIDIGLNMYYYLLLSMLFISGSMYLWTIITLIYSLCSIEKLSIHLFRSSSSSFSSQDLLLFLKSSESCALLLTTPFTSVIWPSIASWRRQFLLGIWTIQLVFLRMVLFISVLFSPILTLFINILMSYIFSCII